MINCKIQLEINNKNGYELKEFEYKYYLGQPVYVIYKGLFSSKYKIKKMEISSFVCTNIPSYQLSNGCNATEDVLFDNIDEAIKECEKRNKRKKYVKNI